MAFLSDRIVVNASITIGTAAGQVVGYVPNASGAKAVLLRISGGTNSANNIVSATLRGVPNQKLGATAAANTFPALSLLNGEDSGGGARSVMLLEVRAF